MIERGWLFVVLWLAGGTAAAQSAPEVPPAGEVSAGEPAPEPAATAHAAESAVVVPGGAEPAARRRLDWTARVLATTAVLEPSLARENPEHRLFQMARAIGRIELRPDLALRLGRLDARVRPRLAVETRRWDAGVRADRTHSSLDGFILESAVRARLPGSLFASLGSENLQWGPGQFSSPSNPFFLENNRGSALAEGRGSYFARVVFAPATRFSLSALANVFEGEQDPFRDFERAYALKGDYLGRKFQLSMIASYGERTTHQAGGYVVWTAADALLLYIEGKVARRNLVLYPAPAANPFALALRDHPGDGPRSAVALAGASYTFGFNVTVTAEYLRNEPGFRDAEARLFYRIRSLSASALLAGGADAPLAARLLEEAARPRARFIRRNYLMSQLRYAWHSERGELLVRHVQNLDDGSGAVIPTVVVPLGEHLELVGVGFVTFGRAESEYRSRLAYQALAGVQVAF